MCSNAAVHRLDDDDRLDTLLDQLQKKVPTAAVSTGRQAGLSKSRRKGPTGNRNGRTATDKAQHSSHRTQEHDDGGDHDDDHDDDISSGTQGSVKSQLAAEMRDLKDKIQQMSLRASRKVNKASTVSA